ncbi:DUF3176 domain-containing protein [Aspergillus candidus]|uniref:Uncharacterized protein n=1 Tax=Aspergillus candidus TaxID=41067 RepID=A0A2I2F6I5_ASPCN|nr:hypothetical protein BDW47DRAFT_132881 [Aspergillus candidus]PLB36247.1 hypothetical protein BDW47DRAFT_132881 [Aspergillus candidus]
MTVESAPLNGAHTEDCEERSLSAAPSETKTHGKKTKAKRSIWLDSWLFEGISLSFSIACLVAIFGVLVAYDNKKRPQLAYKITLNTIISVLATGCKSSLVLVIGEAICQLKWLWFQDPSQRRLFGMQSFDAASRGPLGSLMIVINHRARSFVCLGAALIILLLAFDPFIQQVISYPLVSVPDHDNRSGAAAPQVTKYIPAPKIIDWKNAIMQGLWSSEDMSFEPKCSSGNCTWDPFPSIGICSQCVDLTSIAKLNCSLPVPDKSFNETCHIELPHPWVEEDSLSGNKIIPGSFSISNERGYMSMPNVAIWGRFSVQDLDESDEAYENYPDLLSSEDPDHPNSTFAGVKNPLVAYAYAEIGMKKGQLSENAPTSDDVVLNKVTECGLSSPDTLKPGETIPCWRPKDPYKTDAQPALNLTFCDWDMQKLQSQMSDVLPVVNQIEWQWDSMEGWRTSADITGVEGESDFERNGIELNADRIVTIGFEESMKRIAASLTRLGLKSTNESVHGTVKSDEIFVSVQWPWLVFPASLVLLGTIFLVFTIVLSRKNHVPLWKSSALPSFYHGLEKLGNNEYSTSSLMEKSAESTKVRLQYSKQHGRLMLLREDVENVPLSRPRTM